MQDKDTLPDFLSILPGNKNTKQHISSIKSIKQRIKEHGTVSFACLYICYCKSSSIIINLYICKKWIRYNVFALVFFFFFGFCKCFCGCSILSASTCLPYDVAVGIVVVVFVSGFGVFVFVFVVANTVLPS